jgi:hypothetical protein
MESKQLVSSQEIESQLSRDTDVKADFNDKLLVVPHIIQPGNNISSSPAESENFEVMPGSLKREMTVSEKPT